MIVRDQKLLALATRLAAEADRGRPLHLEPLGGGRNNRVFRVATDRGDPVVLKCYFRDVRDTRDRRLAEWTFLTYARAHGVTNVPKPLATAPGDGASLLGFVTGNRVKPGGLTRTQIIAALDFVIALNPIPRELSAMPAASESCFAIDEHIATVTRRIARLSALDPRAPLRAEASALVADEIVPAWQRVSARLTRAVAADANRHAEPIHGCDVIYSPSDFGFHNALVDDAGRVAFLDFEYAGRDDPAKLLCDFFCQPDVPVDRQYFNEFLDQWASGLRLGDTYRLRASLLLDAYRIKWACIMLNDFLSLGDARRAFADPQQRAERCHTQLTKARAALAVID